MTQDSAKTELISVLAQLYYRDPDIERVVSTAGLPLSLIAWDDRPINTWRSVLTVAEDRGKVEALLDVVRQEKVANEPLRAAIEAYRRTETPPAPPNPPESSASVRLLKTKLGELQRRSDTLTKRIAAVDTDIGRALDGMTHQVLEERRNDLATERDQVASEIEEIERRLAPRS